MLWLFIKYRIHVPNVTFVNIKLLERLENWQMQLHVSMGILRRFQLRWLTNFLSMVLCVCVCVWHCLRLMVCMPLVGSTAYRNSRPRAPTHNANNCNILLWLFKLKPQRNSLHFIALILHVWVCARHLALSVLSSFTVWQLTKKQRRDELWL